MSGVIDKTRKPEQDWTPEEVVALARGNHMWLNAFEVVGSMSEAELAEIGRWVVQSLLDSKMCDDLSGSFPMVYLRVNAS